MWSALSFMDQSHGRWPKLSVTNLMSSKTDASDGFYRSIGQIPSPMKKYNRRVEIEPISTQVKRRRWRWIGHVLRQQTTALTRIALRWTPDGQRKRGRPKETWRRTVEREMKEKGWTWGRLERVSADQHRWRALVEALCATWNTKRTRIISDATNAFLHGHNKESLNKIESTHPRWTSLDILLQMFLITGRDMVAIWIWQFCQEWFEPPPPPPPMHPLPPSHIHLQSTCQCMHAHTILLRHSLTVLLFLFVVVVACLFVCFVLFCFLVSGISTEK